MIKYYTLREKWPNTEFFFWSVFHSEWNLRIQSECGKIWTRKNSVFGHFSLSDKYWACFELGHHAWLKIKLLNGNQILEIFNLWIPLNLKQILLIEIRSPFFWKWVIKLANRLKFSVGWTFFFLSPVSFLIFSAFKDYVKIIIRCTSDLLI